MGYWIDMVVNPKPVTDVGNDPGARNWAALNQAGMIMVSHGLKVPHDTPDQPPRPWVSQEPGSWASQRFGLFSLTVNAYQPDVARQLSIYDWEPGDLKGYVFDSYGALWPFGSDTPMAATGPLGAPFGSQQLIANGTGGTCYNCFAMHSANGLPFGNGGWPDGFGWFISQEGVIVDWGGPVQPLQSPPATTGYTGTLGTGANLVRDFQVDPGGSSQFFVLYDNGWIHSGGAPPGGAGVAISNNFASNHTNAATGVAGGQRWMHVQWDEGWIISCNVDGRLFPHTMATTIPAGGVVKPPPPVPDPPPWLLVESTSPGGGYWQSGDIVPGRDPSRFYIISWDGRAIGPAITGTIQALNPSMAGTTTTTRPTLNWTYNEIAVGVSVSSQKSYNVRVYPTAVTTATGFVVGQNNGAVWINDRTATVTSPGTGSDLINYDLTNGTAYKAYVRVTSAASITSPWANVAFTMAIPLPAAPSSCTTVTHPGTYPTTFGGVDVTAGGSLPSGCLRQFQVSAENGAWEDVIGASATASSTVTDLYPPTSSSLFYRVRNFKRVPATIASAWALSTGTVLAPSSGQPPNGWYLIDVAGIVGPQRVQIAVKKWEVTSIEPRGEFQPLTRNAMVVTSAGVKGTLHNITVRLTSKAEADALWNLLQIPRPLLFEVGAGGYRWWVRPRPGNWVQELVAPTAYYRNVDIELLEVVRPS